MIILAPFTNDGLPATGLSPTIRIRELPSKNLVVTDAAMEEVGDGSYSYDFSGYDSLKSYSIRCDGGNTLVNADRYVFAGNESYVDDIDKVITENERLKRISGLMHENIHIDMPNYDSDGNMTQARVRIYSDAVSVGTDENIIGEYEIAADTFAPGKFTTWKQIKI